MLTILITGGTLEQRIKQSLDHQPKSPYILDGREEGISIEQVRAFQKSLSLANTEANTRYAFILEAQNLSAPAQQALLKLLEEPPKDTQIILTATKSSDLLPTIISRCEVRNLKGNNNQLTQESISDAKNLLVKINSQNHAQLITLAEELVKDQDQLLNLLHLLKQSLHSSPTPKRAKAARLVQRCLNDLKANLQPQLCVEQMLFDLKELT